MAGNFEISANQRKLCHNKLQSRIIQKFYYYFFVRWPHIFLKYFIQFLCTFFYGNHKVFLFVGFFDKSCSLWTTKRRVLLVDYLKSVCIKIFLALKSWYIQIDFPFHVRVLEKCLVWNEFAVKFWFVEHWMSEIFREEWWTWTRMQFSQSTIFSCWTSHCWVGVGMFEKEKLSLKAFSFKFC